MKVLVTGAAGFIGSATSKKLLSQGHQVFGIDNLNNYYDVKLKEARLSRLENEKSFDFNKIDIADKEDLFQVIKDFKPIRILHLAAQAGVRYCTENPYAYLDSNLTGFLNILEAS